MSNYPNIEAIANGTISGEFRDWIKIKPEAKAILIELDNLKSELAVANETADSWRRVAATLEGEKVAANERAEKEIVEMRATFEQLARKHDDSAVLAPYYKGAIYACDELREALRSKDKENE